MFLDALGCTSTENGEFLLAYGHDVNSDPPGIMPFLVKIPGFTGKSVPILLAGHIKQDQAWRDYPTKQ